VGPEGAATVTERRIRNDHPNYELRNARVRVARKEYECAWCYSSARDAFAPILSGETYARISETRLPVCSAHFDESDIVSLSPRGV
jgi:hypothetical protein